MTDYIAILTAILVFITAYYAWQTRVMVKEMEEARKYQFIPSLKIMHTRLFLGSNFDVEICNIGMGPAKNIRGTLKLEPGSEEVNFVYDILYPKESFSLNSPFKSIKSDSDVEKLIKVWMIASFDDIANNPHKVTDRFLCEDIGKMKNDEYKRDKTVEALNRIEKQLRNIEKAIK